MQTEHQSVKENTTNMGFKTKEISMQHEWQSLHGWSQTTPPPSTKRDGKKALPTRQMQYSRLV
jgi:hypothetical protein